MSTPNTQLISVIIPAYNVEPYVEECIDSVRNQTYKHLEIIVVDDGSKDSTGSICDKKAAEDKQVRVIHKPNGGLSSARNAGIESAVGEFICFIDGDDVLHPEFAERLLDAVNSNNLDCAFCDFEKFTSKPEYCSDKTHQDISEYSRDEMLMILSDVQHKDRAIATIVCNKLFKRSIFDGLRFIYGKIHEDEFVIHKLIGKCDKIGYLHYVGYYYRTRSDSITGSWNNYSLKHLDVVDAYADRLEYVKKLGNTMLIDKMSVSMCEIILMEYIDAWENKSLKKTYSDSSLTMDQYFRRRMRQVLLTNYSHLSPRTLLKYIRFIISPVSFYNKYWKKDISQT